MSQETGLPHTFTTSTLESLDDFRHFVRHALLDSDSDSVISVDLKSFGLPGTLDELDDVVKSC